MMIAFAPGATVPLFPDVVPASPSYRRIYAINLAVAMALVLLTPLVAYTRLLLFSFYSRGSFLLDAGLLADLLWHSDPALTLPSSIGGGSYFATHVTVLFLPIAMLSRLLPLSMAQFFALFIGASHALLAFSVFWMVVASDRQRRPATPWLAMLAGLGFTFSGLAIAIVRYPHFEILIVAFFLLFITALGRNRLWLAAVFFVCGLLVREDAGLHYSAVLGLWALCDAFYGIKSPARRAVWGFAIAGLLYSCTALAIQHVAFPSATSAFSRVYLGDPPLAHLTASTLRNRLLYVFSNRSYIWIPGCALLLWARIVREPFLAIGYLASAPWLILQFLAASPFPAALASYYAFPCLIGMAWPLAAVLLGRMEAKTRISALVGFGVLVMLSFLPGNDMHDPGRLHVATAMIHKMPSRARQADIDYAVASIGRARPSLGRLQIDNSVAALAPNSFSQDQVEATPGLGRAGIDKADTVVFFEDGYDAERLRSVAQTSGLAHRYAIPGTPLHLASSRSLTDISGLRGLIAPE